MPSQWNECRERDLLHSIFLVAAPKVFGPEDKEAIVQEMKLKGYQDITWNGIR